MRRGSDISAHSSCIRPLCPGGYKRLARLFFRSHKSPSQTLSRRYTSTDHFLPFLLSPSGLGCSPIPERIEAGGERSLRQVGLLPAIKVKCGLVAAQRSAAFAGVVGETVYPARIAECGAGPRFLLFGFGTCVQAGGA